MNSATRGQPLFGGQNFAAQMGKGNFHGRVQQPAQVELYKVLDLLGAPADHDFAPVGYTRRIQEDLDALSDQSRLVSLAETIETVYSGRNVVNISDNVMFNLLIDRLSFLDLLIPNDITRERNFAAFQVLHNILPHQFTAHGVPGRSMTMQDHAWQMSKQTQNAAIEFDLRVLEDPEYGLRIIKEAGDMISTSAALTLDIRKISYLLASGIHAVYNQIINNGNAASGALDGDENALAWQWRNFGACCFGPDRFVNSMLSTRNIIASHAGKSPVIMIVPEGFLSELAARQDPTRAQDTIAYFSMIGGEQISNIGLPAKTFSSYGIVPLRGIDGVYAVALPNLLINEITPLPSLLDSVGQFPQHYCTRQVLLNKPDRSPHCNPGSINVYDLNNGKRVPRTIAEGVPYAEIFDTEDPTRFSNTVLGYIESLPNRELIDESSSAFVSKATAVGNTIVDIAQADGEHAAIFARWSPSKQKHVPIKYIGDMRLSYLFPGNTDAQIEYMLLHYRGFANAIKELKDLLDTLSAIPMTQAWARAVAEENAKRLWTWEADGTLRSVLESAPDDRNQPFSIIPEWPRNAHGGFDLPSTVPAEGLDASSIGAGFANGPGILTLAASTNKLYENLSARCREVITRVNEGSSEFMRVFGPSLVNDLSTLDAWWHRSAEHIITKLCDNLNPGKPLFFRAYQPENKAGASKRHPKKVSDDGAKHGLIDQLRPFTDRKSYDKYMFSGLDLSPDVTQKFYAIVDGISTSLLKSTASAEIKTLPKQFTQRIILHALGSLPTATPQAQYSTEVLARFDDSKAAVKLYNHANPFLTGVTHPSLGDPAVAEAINEANLTLLFLTGRLLALGYFNVFNQNFAKLDPRKVQLKNVDKSTSSLADIIDSIPQVKTAYDEAVAAYQAIGRDQVIREPLYEPGIAPSDDIDARFAWVRSPLTANNKETALLCYTNADSIVVVGDYQTGYGTPCLYPADVWPIPAADIGGGNRLRGVRSSALFDVNRFVNTSPMELDRDLVLAVSRANATGDDVRGASATLGRQRLTKIIGDSSILGMNVFENSVFQRPELSMEIEGPMLQRFKLLARNPVMQYDVALSYFYLSYLLMPMTKFAVDALSNSKQLVPFDLLMMRVSTYNTKNVITATLNCASMKVSPPYVTMDADHAHDFGHIFSRIDAGVLPNNLTGSVVDTNIIITSNIHGLTADFIHPTDFRLRLTDPSAVAVADRSAASFIALPIPITVPVPNIIKWSGKEVSQQVYSALNPKSQMPSGGRLATLGFLHYCYEGFELAANDTVPIYRTMSNLTAQKVLDMTDSHDVLSQIMAGQNSIVPRYSFLGSHTYTDVDGTLIGKAGIGNMGELIAQDADATPVYRGDRVIFNLGPLQVGSSYSTK